MTEHEHTLDALAGLEPGATVRTPTGREARVVAIDEARGEVLVEWPAERASFRLRRLRPAGTRGER